MMILFINLAKKYPPICALSHVIYHFK